MPSTLLLPSMPAKASILLCACSRILRHYKQPLQQPYYLQPPMPLGQPPVAQFPPPSQRPPVPAPRQQGPVCQPGPRGRPPPPTRPRGPPSQPPRNTACLAAKPLPLHSTAQQAVLPLLKATATDPKGQTVIPVQLLFDSGSSQSYVTQKTVDSLHLKVKGKVNLRAVTMYQKKPTTVKGKLVEMTLVHAQDKSKTVELELIVLPTITAPISSPPAQYSSELTQKLLNLGIPSDSCNQDGRGITIDVLLGSAHLPLLLDETPSITKLAHNLVCLQTLLGPVLMGNQPSGSHPDASLLNSAIPIEAEDSTLNEYLNCIKDVELNGKQTPKVWTPDNTSARKWVRETTIINPDSGAFFLRYPFKHADPQSYCSNNFGMAMGRMRSMHNRLSPTEQECYYQSWMKLLDETTGWGPALESADFPPREGTFTHYLSVLTVSRPDNLTTPIRPVADTSARTSQGSSLNQVLFTGQVQSNIVQTLLQFRIYKHGLISDVMKAFYSLRIQEQERDACRLPLPRDWKLPLNHANYRIVRYQRLPMGLVCSPWLLEETVMWTLEEACQEATDAQAKSLLPRLLSSFYVDNCLTGFDTPEEGVKLVQLSFNTLKARPVSSIPMEFKSPGSPSRSPQERLPGQTPGQCPGSPVEHYGGSPTPVGVPCTLPTLQPEDLDTRRKLASRIASHYDPFGLLLPITIQGRFLLAELPTLLESGNVNWDKSTGYAPAQRWIVIEKRDRQSSSPTVSPSPSFRPLKGSSGPSLVFGC